MDQITFPKGTIIKVGGIPFELLEDIVVLGNKENLALIGEALRNHTTAVAEDEKVLVTKPNLKFSIGFFCLNCEKEIEGNICPTCFSTNEPQPEDE